MEQVINIALSFKLATGEVTLNEIVYRLQELQKELMLKTLKQIVTWYDDLIAERLSVQNHYSSRQRRGLGVHSRKGAGATSCPGRRAQKIGYRKTARKLKTVFGTLELPVRQMQCCRCGKKFSPLLSALKIGAYARRESNIEYAVTEAVIDTNYRRLIEGRSIDISLGGVHNIVVGSDIDRVFEEPVDMSKLSAIMADGSGVKQKKGSKGELRTVIGITHAGRVTPLGCFVNTQWADAEKIVRLRLRQDENEKSRQCPIPFVYDGEPGLDGFLSDIAQSQRCTWHAPRGLYHALWQDGLKKKDSQPEMDRVKQLVGIELPGDDFELLQDSDKQAVQDRYSSSKAEIKKLIETFSAKGYTQGATYLENLSRQMFRHIEVWLETGVIAPKATSLLERVFREIGRRLKRIAWGWSDKAVTNLSKMIMIRQYERGRWEQYWKEKLGIKGFFEVQVQSVSIS